MPIKLPCTSKAGQVTIPYANCERDLKTFSVSHVCGSAEKVLDETLLLRYSRIPQNIYTGAKILYAI